MKKWRTDKCEWIKRKYLLCVICKVFKENKKTSSLISLKEFLGNNNNNNNNNNNSSSKH